MKYLYTAWFRDHQKRVCDQEFDWPAYLVIEAESERSAREWGDKLALQRLDPSGSEQLLYSSAEVADSWPAGRIAAVPRIQHGEIISATEIGW